VPHLYPDVAARKRAFQRLDHELSVILRLGFTDYFLVVWDVVRQAREWGYPCLGRGSAAASIVSYCLGITPVDPIRYDLYFERFLNPERTSPPDIDVDFGTSRRDRILRYIYDSYGEERVAMISTITRFAGRGALREAGKALGYSDRELSSLCRRLPHVRAGNLRESLEKRPECRRLPFRDEPFRTLIPLAERLAETPRGWGIHCGGVVITPDPLTHHLALTRSANGLIITQPDMGPVEAMGLMKLDILGNRSLDVLPDTLAQLKGEGVGPIDLTLATVSNNSATKSLIREGRTIGCFYIESPGMRQLLRKLRVEDFPALTAASSIIRPGVAESGMMAAYISRHHDPASVTYLHPRLSELLGETHGIMVYQEDVIRVVHDLAGMTLGEADLFRRAMSGKLRSREAMEATRALFLERCRAQGLDRSVTEELYRQIASFAGYSFCKAHSAAFATLSFQVAYLKAHYPAEFLAAVLSNGGGFYPPLAYISEARRLGLTLLPPDINRARVHYVGNGTTLRVGLSCVKGVGNELARRIVHERDKGGAFLSLHDFLRRTRADRDAVISLINAGGCSYLNPDPRVLHWHLRLSRNGQHTEAFPLPADIPAFPPETSLERARREWDALGYTLEAHPMALIGRPAGCLPAAELSSHAGQRVRVAGILITAKRTRVKKSGEGMAFLDMEDESDTFAATLFPRVYREYAHLLDGRGPYLVCGRVEEDHGALSVTTEQLFRIDQRGIRRSGSGRAEKRGNGDGRVSA